MTRRASPKTQKRRKRSDKGTAVADSTMPKRTDNEADASHDIVRDGFTLDFISGTKEVKLVFDSRKIKSIRNQQVNRRRKSLSLHIGARRDSRR